MGVPPILGCAGEGVSQPHRIMGGPLQLDFDLGAGGIGGATAWGKGGGGCEHPGMGGRGVPQPRGDLMPR